MNPSYDFHGQVALVTGASSGMGLATAKAFAEAGATLFAAAIALRFLQGSPVLQISPTQTGQGDGDERQA
jgi:NAD(P)-dependent dehydrogenase (short-subunit alcohol dehydrogenase family)